MDDRPSQTSPALSDPARATEAGTLRERVIAALSARLGPPCSPEGSRDHRWSVSPSRSLPTAAAARGSIVLVDSFRHPDRPIVMVFNPHVAGVNAIRAYRIEAVGRVDSVLERVVAFALSADPVPPREEDDIEEEYTA